MTNRFDAILYSIAFYSYLIAFLSYIIHVALRNEQAGRMATSLMFLGVIPHTAAFFVRWYIQGHVPLANMYEYMGTMSWMIVVGLLYFTFRYRNRRIGVFVSPIAIIMLVVASLLPSDVNRQLMPALQSTWLVIHVTLAALGSGAFLISFAGSSLYLLSEPEKPKSSLSMFLAFWVIIPLLVGIILKFSGILPVTMDLVPPEKIGMLAGMKISSMAIGVGSGAIYCGRLMIGLGIGMIVGAILWPLAHRQLAGTKDHERSGARIFIVVIISLLLSAIIAGFMIKQGWMSVTPRSYFKIFELFGPVLVISWLVTPVVNSILSDRWLSKLGLSRQIFEEVSHSAVAIGYPLYTIGALFAGAIWAEQAWGTWWSWDPKEVGALIIWLFYTGYLHARYQRKWQGVPAAALVVLGMVMVFLSFFGNYFFGGLHSFEVT